MLTPRRTPYRLLLISYWLSGCFGTMIADNALRTPPRVRRDYGTAGCGLGSVIFGSARAQFVAAATNSMFWNNASGISSETLNCRRPTASSAELERYFISNFVTLERESARGEGETLTGLAGVLGCGQTESRALAAGMHTHYQAIFSQPGAVAALSQAVDCLSREAPLVSGCKYFQL